MKIAYQSPDELSITGEFKHTTLKSHRIFGKPITNNAWRQLSTSQIRTKNRPNLGGQKFIKVMPAVPFQKNI
jgi:hypothetical protein